MYRAWRMSARCRVGRPERLPWRPHGRHRQGIAGGKCPARRVLGGAYSHFGAQPIARSATIHRAPRAAGRSTYPATVTLTPAARPSTDTSGGDPKAAGTDFQVSVDRIPDGHLAGEPERKGGRVWRGGRCGRRHPGTSRSSQCPAPDGAAPRARCEPIPRLHGQCHEESVRKTRSQSHEPIGFRCCGLPTPAYGRARCCPACRRSGRSR